MAYEIVTDGLALCFVSLWCAYVNGRFFAALTAFLTFLLTKKGAASWGASPPPAPPRYALRPRLRRSPPGIPQAVPARPLLQKTTVGVTSSAPKGARGIQPTPSPTLPRRGGKGSRLCPPQSNYESPRPALRACSHKIGFQKKASPSAPCALVVRAAIARRLWIRCRIASCDDVRYCITADADAFRGSRVSPPGAASRGAPSQLPGCCCCVHFHE